MSVDDLLMYNYMAVRLNSDTFADIEQLQQAINDGNVDKRCVPTYSHYLFNLDNNDNEGRVYNVRNGLGWLKMKDGQLIEHWYCIPYLKCFYGIDIKTDERITRVDIPKNVEHYVDLATNQEIMTTTFCVFDAFPDDYKATVNELGIADNVFGYSDRPQGRVVYVR